MEILLNSQNLVWRLAIVFPTARSQLKYEGFFLQPPPKKTSFSLLPAYDAPLSRHFAKSVGFHTI